VIGLLLLILLGVLIAVIVKRAAGRAYTSEQVFREPSALDLSGLLARDPNFSRAVFEDFVFELYAHAHRVRGTPALQALQPYLSAEAIATVEARGATPSQIVIGMLRLEDHTMVSPEDRITVAIEATHLADKSMFAVENWVFVRALGVLSKPPATRTWPCPNCGAAWVASPTRNCAHCGELVGVGNFDWCVEAIEVVSVSSALASLTGTVPEEGNDLPTVYDPRVEAAMRDITSLDPAVTFEALKPRIALIYDQVNKAWNASELTPIRGLVTAAQRNYLEYWLREYAHQELRNSLADAKISEIQLAKVTRDKFYDAITVRIFADGCDSTVDSKGKVVGGSTTKRRAYTEYWTLLRASTRRGPVIATPTCPNCGAPLEISDAGSCLHCNATVENGSFDWVLSKIEQDDNYAG
jgi:hypothetical protein